MEATAEIVPFARKDVDFSKEDFVEAIHLWTKTRSVADALSQQEIGALQGLRRIDALRKAALYMIAEYYRKHDRADVAPGVAVAIALLSDNDRGAATISQEKLATLFGRSRTAIGAAQSRLREDGFIRTTRGRYAASYPVVPRALAQQYNHTVWLIDAICAQDASVNCQDSPDNCQLSSQPLQLDQLSVGTEQLESVNCRVEPVSIVKPDLHKFTKENSTTLNRATAAAAIGIVTAMTSVPAAAEPPSPSPIVQPASSISMRDLSDRLFDAAGNAMRRGEPGLEVMSTPRSWVENGCDVEMDILPTVRAIAARKPPQSISTWRFFTNAIADAKESRLAPLPEGRASGFERRVENAVKDRPKTWQEKQDAAYDYIFRKKD
jgi:biotin operon repressor